MGINEIPNPVGKVAVPTPGPYTSSERILTDLQEVLLIGKPKSTTAVIDQARSSAGPMYPLITLKRDKTTNTWKSSGEHSQYARHIFG
jgi:hypothetical protein